MLTINTVFAVLSLAIQLLTTANQPGVSPEVHQQAVTVANNAIATAMTYIGNNPQSTIVNSFPASTTDGTISSNSTTTDTGAGVVTLPQATSTVTSTVVMVEVPFSELARLDFRKYLDPRFYDLSKTLAFYIYPVRGGNATMTLNGETKAFIDGSITFSNLTPNTEYSYSTRVEHGNKFAVATGTVATQ